MRQTLKLGFISFLSSALLFNSFYSAGAYAADSGSTGPKLVNANYNEMNFGQPVKISGADKSVNAVYKYSNVLTKDGVTVDAKVTILEKTDSPSLGYVDESNSNSQLQKRFNPTLKSKGTFTFKFEFLDQATQNPVLLENFYVTGIDIDGDSSTREFIEVSGFSSYTVNNPTGLTIGAGSNGRTQFKGLSYSLNDIQFDDSASFIAHYKDPVSAMQLTIGNTGNTGSSFRLFSVNFGAPGGVFTSPKTTDNPSSPTINVTIQDGGDGHLSAAQDDLSAVTISGTTNAEAGQPVTVTVTDSAGSASNLTTSVQTGPSPRAYSVTGDFRAYAYGTITAEASVVNLQGNPKSASDTTVKENVAPTATGVTITGTATSGQVVSGNYVYGDTENDLEGVSTFKWYRGTQANGSNKSLIAGATSKSYTLTTADVGNYIFFEVTPVAKTGTSPGAAVVSGASALVQAANTPPTATAQSVTTAEDTPANITLSGTDAETPASLSYTVTGQPAHGTLSGTGSSLVYTPNANYNGPDSFKFKVTDSGGLASGEAVVSITVSEVNDVPAATNVAIVGTTTVGQTLTGSYTYSDVDGDGEGASAFKWYRGENADGNGKTPINGAISETYTLTADDLGKRIFFEVTPKAATGANPGAAVVSVATGAVTAAPNTAPTATAQSVTTAEDTPANITLSGTDAETPASLSYTVTVQPARGTLSGTGSSLVYTPNANYNGPDSFKFKVTDSGGLESGEAVVSITVSEVNDVPSATYIAIAGTISVGQTLTGSYTYSDVDGDGEGASDLQWYRGAQANGSDKTPIAAATSDTYTLTAAEAGKYVFFEVTPIAAAGANPGAAVLSAAAGPVEAAGNGTPTATPQSITLDEDTTASIKLSGSDPGNPDGKLIYTVTSLPAHGTLSGCCGELVYTPFRNYFGPDSFKFKAINSNGTGSGEATVSINVVPVNDAPTAIAPTITTLKDEPVNFTLNGSDVETPAEQLEYTITVAPAHGTLSGSGRNWIYTPDSGYHGTDGFKFTVTDGDGLDSAETTVSIAVETMDQRLSLYAANMADAYDKQELTAAYIYREDGYIIYSIDNLGVRIGDVVQYQMGTNTGAASTVRVEYLDENYQVIGYDDLDINGRNDCYYAEVPAGTAFVKINGVPDASLNIYEISSPSSGGPGLPACKDANNLDHAYDKKETTSANIFTSEGCIVYKLSNLGIELNGYLGFLMGASNGGQHTVKVDFLDGSYNPTGNSYLDINGFKEWYNAAIPADSVYVRINGISVGALYIYEIEKGSATTPTPTPTHTPTPTPSHSPTPTPSHTPTPTPTPTPTQLQVDRWNDANNIDHAYDKRDTTSANIFSAGGYIIYKLSDLGIPTNGNIKFQLGSSTGTQYTVKVDFLDVNGNLTGSCYIGIDGHKDFYSAVIPANSAYVRINGISPGALYIYEIAAGAGGQTPPPTPTPTPSPVPGLPLPECANNLADAYDKRDTTSANIFTTDCSIVYKLSDLGIQAAGSIQYLLGTNTGGAYTAVVEYLDQNRNVLGTGSMGITGFKDYYSAPVPADTVYIKLNGLQGAHLYIYEIAGSAAAPGQGLPVCSVTNIAEAYDKRDTTSANILTGDCSLVYKLSDLGVSANGGIRFLLGTNVDGSHTATVVFLDAGSNPVGSGILAMSGTKGYYSATVPAAASQVKINGLPGAHLYIYEIDSGSAGPVTPPNPGDPATQPSMSVGATNMAEAYDLRDTTSANILTGEGYIIYKLSDLGMCNCSLTGGVKYLIGSNDGAAHAVKVDYLDGGFNVINTTSLSISGFKSSYVSTLPNNAVYLKIYGVPGAMIYIYEIMKE